jgi:heme exporter protein D
MNWKSFADFIHMGGYGFYVWGSYFFTALCIAIELLVLRLRGKALEDDPFAEDKP